jgi:hypothetical protein
LCTLSSINVVGATGRAPPAADRARSAKGAVTSPSNTRRARSATGRASFRGGCRPPFARAVRPPQGTSCSRDSILPRTIPILWGVTRPMATPRLITAKRKGVAPDQTTPTLRIMAMADTRHGIPPTTTGQRTPTTSPTATPLHAHTGRPRTVRPQPHGGPGCAIDTSWFQRSFWRSSSSTDSLALALNATSKVALHSTDLCVRFLTDNSRGGRGGACVWHSIWTHAVTL